MKDAYIEIGEQIVKKNYLHLNNRIFDVYIEKLDNPLDYLKSCCQDTSTYACWKAIKLIKEKYDDNNFCLEVAREYLKSDDKDFIYRAVDILFFLNQEDSLLNYEILLDYMKETQRGDAAGYFPEETSNYNQLNEVDLIESLFYKIFIEKNSNSFYLHKSRSFFKDLISNLGSIEEGYEQINTILEKIRLNVKNNPNQTFHINSLIETNNNALLKEKSKDLSIDQVIEVLND